LIRSKGNISGHCERRGIFFQFEKYARLEIVKRFEMYFVLARIPLDFLAGLGAWWLARIVRPYTDLVPVIHSWFDPRFIPDADFFVPFSLAAAGGLVLVAAIMGAYRFTEQHDLNHEIPRLFFIAVFWGMAIISFFALVYRTPVFSRMMLAQAMVFAVAFALLFRLILRSLRKLLWKNGFGVSRLVLLGSEKNLQEFKRLLKAEPRYRVVGAVAPEATCELENTDEVWHLDRHLPAEREEALRELCYRSHKIFRFVPPSAMAFARLDITILGGVALLKPIPAVLTGWGRIAKRGLDIAGSLFCLIVLAPVLAAIALGVRLSSPGPVFYGSVRIGRDGKPFTMWKFRSMVADADRQKKALAALNHRHDGPFFKVKNDPRVTVFGRFLRRFSLDELPQLFNVLQGDMALIGSRPHFPEEIKKIDPELRRVLAMRPGITGLSQVSGRSDLDFAREMQLDLYYLEHWSVFLDLKILLRTLWVIGRGKGAD
jgi:exopolysaccharide biosynthesis polyprenyl glycosylphosphotransferase